MAEVISASKRWHGLLSSLGNLRIISARLAPDLTVWLSYGSKCKKVQVLLFGCTALYLQFSKVEVNVDRL